MKIRSLRKVCTLEILRKERDAVRELNKHPMGYTKANGKAM